MSGLWAAGGMVSSPRDLNRFIAADAGGELLSQATHDQQFTFVDGLSQPSGPGRNEAGLGIFRYTTPCGVVYGHTGNVGGYTQFAAATADGRRSVTLSLTEQLSDSSAAPLVSQFRAIEGQLVCRAMEG
jgi:D-alanyl-D-alanine carboxypeptidase